MTETTPPPPSPKQLKAQKIQKTLDKGLNVLLVLAVIVWFTNTFLRDDTHELDNAKKLEKLQNEALNAFNEAKHPPKTPPKQRRPELPAPSIAFLASDLDLAINDQSNTPTLVFFYASWCPYCHKMFPKIAHYAKDSQGLRILPVSIDEDPAKLNVYLTKEYPQRSFTPYVFSNATEMLGARNILAKKGLQFNGSIPYLAVFHHGKALAQVQGLIKDDELEKLVQQAKRLPNQHATP